MKQFSGQVNRVCWRVVLFVCYLLFIHRLSDESSGRFRNVPAQQEQRKPFDPQLNESVFYNNNGVDEGNIFLHLCFPLF